MQDFTTLHFINAINDGAVTKIYNINSDGRPGLLFKKLEEIYEAESARNLDAPPTLDLQDGHNIEIPCLPNAESRTSEGNLEADSDDITFEESTLNQLLKRCKTKKRKISDNVGLTPKQELTYSQQEGMEDDDDLEMPLSTWKLKLSKTSKSIKHSPSVCATVTIKSKLPEVDFSESQVTSSGTADMSFCVVDTSRVFRTADTVSENKEARPSAGEAEKCVTSEVCYSQLDDVDLSSPLLPPFIRESTELNSQKETTGQHYSVPSVSEFQKEVVSGSDSGFPVSDMAIDENLSRDKIGHGRELCMFEDDIMESFEIAENYLNPNNDIAVLEDDSSTHQKQQLVFATADAEKNSGSGVVVDISTPEDTNYHDVDLWEPPFMLPSARKAMSPTCQEKLCLAMDTVELDEDIDHKKGKGKLVFREQIEIMALPAESDTEALASPMKDERPGQVARTKTTINPNKVILKKHIKKICSPPKGRLEWPRLPLSLPRLSTGCNSIEVCSESAIAFSQQQMQDTESLAWKLMDELKSMKDMMEEKMLLEACHNTSLRNDADKVAKAIKRARKVDEKAKKLLSIMSRDCNRFCRIMELTEDGSAAKENVINKKEKKKISFADEAGGTLCQVNIFENGKASEETISENQKKLTEDISAATENVINSKEEKKIPLADEAKEW